MQMTTRHSVASPSRASAQPRSKAPTCFSIIGALVSVISIHALAAGQQPTCPVPAGDRPASVAMHADGSVELLDRSGNALDAQAILPLNAWPQQLRVLELRSDGTTTRGLSARNTETRASSTLFRSAPLYVQIETNGTYRIVRGRYSLQASPGGFAPGVDYHLPGSELIPVVLPRPQAAPDAPGPFSLLWDAKVNTFPLGKEFSVEHALNRTRLRIEGLLGQDTGEVIISFLFGRLSVTPPVLARTNTSHLPYKYDLVQTTLVDLAKQQGEPPAEIQFYENLPGGGGVPVMFSFPFSVSQLFIEVPYALHKAKWDPGAPAIPVATITVNELLVNDIDFEPLDGVISPDVSFDIMLMHEVLHALGYTSWLEDPADNDMSLWDIFRLSNSTAGQGASSTALATSPRMLIPGVEAVGVTAMNAASLVYRMSTGEHPPGDMWAASHWKDDVLLGNYIGIMVPRLIPGDGGQASGLLLASDKRGMDTLGWNVRIGQDPQGAQPAVPGQPPNGQQRVGFRPEFQWTAGNFALTHNLYVWKGTVPTSPNRIHAAEDLTGVSYTMPYGVLDENTLYTWMVTAINNIGYSYSMKWTFTTRCYADCNADGALSVADYTCFQTMYSQGNIEADCNESGGLTVADFTCFQSHYSAGCP